MEESMQPKGKASGAPGLESKLRPPQGRASSYHSDADGTKRRSLLPQPGHTRHTSQLADAAPPRAGTIPQPTAPSRPRPKSMYQTGDSFLQARKAEDKPASARSIRPPNSISKPPEPQLAGLDRTRSLRRPNVSAQSNPASTSSGHGRAQSTSNVPISRREGVAAKLNTERPKSLLPALGGNGKHNAISTATESTAPRASARLAGLSRTDSSKIRSEIPSGGAPTRPVSRPEDPIGPQSRRRETVRDEQTRTARPAFTTLQQHFTPRKTGKAPTSTFLHPAPAPSVSSLPPEIVSLQSELLQLHLLHQRLAEIDQQWEASAQRSLHKKFEEVASLHQAMLERERAGQEQKNIQALVQWTDGASSSKLIQYVQVLSGPLHELPGLVEPGGRLQRLMGVFQDWVSRVDNTWVARLNFDSNNSVEGLGDSWRAENAALTRKVISFSRDLDQISPPSSESSIACIVDTCKIMLKGLADELDVMQAIEAEVAVREKEWVAGRLQAIADHVDSHPSVNNGDTAAWRT
ncbi:hypothetical protein BKA63DRAFT_257535 [Paraphoma chrysanthemicola]|nr:hypothetical protein BKA63DRAFT_257535 [Paraphoma chrysanthemicola]